MSATFKISKKKPSQIELRRLMNEHKNKKDVKPITSPLAKFNENGQLTCVLCMSVVRSAAVWPVHLNSKQHRDSVEAAKNLKEKTNNFTTSKRALSPQPETPPKKLKSILKKPGGATSSDMETDAAPQDTNNGQDSSLPTDFFDSKATEKPSSSSSSSRSGMKSARIEKGKAKDAMADPTAQDEALPEGFFDDPKLDAKARNQEYRDPIEEEWEKFQKAIREADDESAAIIAEDQEEATAERQIDEIDEQIKHLSKVLVLEKKKQEITVTASNKASENDEDSDVDEKDFDEFLDWRSKKSFK